MTPALFKSIDTAPIPMKPAAYCQEKAARSGSSFYYSFLFLSPEQRRAITALYAFCREVDDRELVRVDARRGRELRVAVDLQVVVARDLHERAAAEREQL